jgi:uncharacterized protein (TIGR03437 family)
MRRRLLEFGHFTQVWVGGAGGFACRRLLCAIILTLALLSIGAASAQPIAGDLAFVRTFTGLEIRAMATAPDGSILVAGGARNAGLPVTTGPAFNPSTCGVSPGPAPLPNPCGDAYFARFSPAGALLYGAYVGGSGSDGFDGIAVATNGDAFLLGHSGSADFQTGRGPFLMLIRADGTTGFARAIGTDPDAIAIAVAVSTTSVYVAGHTGGDAFLKKFDAANGADIFTKSFGGSSFDYVSALAVDAAGNAYVAGSTTSADFPVTGWHSVAAPTPLQSSIFVTQVNADGRILASAVFGGESADYLDRIAIAPNGDVLLAGTTLSRQFPATPGAVQSENFAGNAAWIVRLPPTLSAPVFSTLIEIYTTIGAVLPQLDGTIVLYGNTQFNFFPTTPDAAERCPATMFVARLAADGTSIQYASFLTIPGQAIAQYASISTGRIVIAGGDSLTLLTRSATLPPSRLCAVGSAGFDRFLTWAGEYVTIFGASLAPRSVLVNGVAAEILYSSPAQVNVLVPPLARTGLLHIEVDGAGTIDAPTADTVPGLFRQYTTYFAAALNQDATVNGPATAALPGDRLTLFGTGFGPVSPIRIFLNSVEAPVLSTDGLRIQIQVPDLPPGRYPVNFQAGSLFQLGLVEVQVGAAPPRL